MFTARASVTIGRPLREVQAQFMDVAYHERNRHHRGVTFTVSNDTAESCTYSQASRVGPIHLRQQFRLGKGDPSHQVNELVSGPFAPGAITFDITDAGDGSSMVVATLQSTRRGLTRLAAPLLRRPLSRALARGLDEDRIDLESGRYSSV